MSDGSDRLERDVEEVLSNIEDFDWRRRQSRRPGPIRIAAQRFGAALVSRATSLTPNHLLLLGALMLIIGLVLRGGGLWLAIAGIVIFVIGLFWTSRGGNPQGQSAQRRLLARSLHQLRAIFTESITTVLPAASIDAARRSRAGPPTAPVRPRGSLAGRLRQRRLHRPSCRRDIAAGRSAAARSRRTPSPKESESNLNLNQQQTEVAEQPTGQDQSLASEESTSDDEPPQQSEPPPIRPGGPPEPDLVLAGSEPLPPASGRRVGSESLGHRPGTRRRGLPRGILPQPRIRGGGPGVQLHDTGGDQPNRFPRWVQLVCIPLSRLSRSNRSSANWSM